VVLGCANNKKSNYSENSEYRNYNYFNLKKTIRASSQNSEGFKILKKRKRKNTIKKLF
jgi:hypothetical protein